MNVEDAVMGMITGLMILALLMMAILLPIAMIESRINNPGASENALLKCKALGFDYAENYHRPIFSQEAYGVECGIIDYTRKDIDVESKNAETIVLG